MVKLKTLRSKWQLSVFNLRNKLSWKKVSSLCIGWSLTLTLSFASAK